MWRRASSSVFLGVSCTALPQVDGLVAIVADKATP
jgi:hypothetical protein